MIPFFIFLLIIIFNILSFILLYLSILEIEVKELKIDTEKKINNYLIYIRLKLFKRITWAKIKIDNNKVEKYKKINNKIINKISNDLKKQAIDLKSFKNLRTFKTKIKRVNIRLKIGLLNPPITALLTSVISIVISNILANKVIEYNEENCKYIIEPIYSTKPQLKLNLNCIINVKMVHIISIIYMLNFKGSEANGKFSSNRRAYESLNV